MRHLSQSWYRKIAFPHRVFLVIGVVTAAAWGAPVQGQCELQTLWSPEGGPDHYFGFAAAGSASLDVLVVGEFGDGDFAGAVYIYRRVGDVWELETMLVAPDGPIPFSQLGRQVAMSADGKTILVAELLDDNGGGNNAGAVWVFIEEGGRWQVQQKLIASDAQDGWVLGEKVAISADGNTAVASATGAPGDPVYVFVRDGNRWTQVQTLTGEGALGLPWLGVSADGGMIVVGATGDDDQGQGAGAAYIFLRDGAKGPWAFHQKILASDGEPHDSFGRSPSVSSNGDTILVGANGDDEAGLNAGAAYVFERRGDLWFEQVKLFASDADGQNRFGAWLTITPDGQRAIIKGGGNTVYVFDREDNGWVETMRIRPWHEDVWSQGWTPNITDDGSIALLGAPGSQVDGEFWYGAAVLFDLEAPLGDLDCDGFITVVDLLALLASWGPCDCESFGGCPADLDLDCTVGVSDLLILLANWS